MVGIHEGHWACPMTSLSPDGDFCEKTHLNSAVLSNAPLPSPSSFFVMFSSSPFVFLSLMIIFKWGTQIYKLLIVMKPHNLPFNHT